MPTVLRSGPYRVYFYSHDLIEPPHVHIDRDVRSARFWLNSVTLARNLGFKPKERSKPGRSYYAFQHRSGSGGDAQGGPMIGLCLLAARHHEQDPVVTLIGMVALIAVGVALFIREMGATYNVVTKGGAPYCPLCNRQVSFRRDYCRSCGYRFKSYESSYSQPTRASRESKPFIDEGTKKVLTGVFLPVIVLASLFWMLARFLGRSTVRVMSCRWLGDTPDWLQPIAWAMLAIGLVAGPLLWLASGRSPVALVVALLWAALAVSAIAHVYGAWRQGKASVVSEPEDRKLDDFASTITRELKAQSTKKFDVLKLASESGVPPRVAGLATEQVYAMYARTIMADGVVTEIERARIDKLASLLGVGPDLASRIEEAARVSRYHIALADAMEDGVITREEAASLQELRESLGLTGVDVPQVGIRLNAIDVGDN